MAPQPRWSNALPRHSHRPPGTVHFLTSHPITDYHSASRSLRTLPGGTTPARKKPAWGKKRLTLASPPLPPSRRASALALKPNCDAAAASLRNFPAHAGRAPGAGRDLHAPNTTVRQGGVWPGPARAIAAAWGLKDGTTERATKAAAKQAPAPHSPHPATRPRRAICTLPVAALNLGDTYLILLRSCSLPPPPIALARERGSLPAYIPAL